MKHTKTSVAFCPGDNAIMQNSIPIKMLIACVFSCIIGIVLMAVTSRYLLMAVFIGVLVCVGITTPFLAAGKISVTTACLAPTLLLCFVYTPLSWFTFDGLLGCTPYLSILFVTVIILTYYSRIQTLILSLYGALMLGLTILWLATRSGDTDVEQIVNVLAAYVLTAALTVCIIEGVKRRNLEINKQITSLSLRDDLTGLLNRRAIDQVLINQESAFSKEGSEYAVVMMDIDRFKSINDHFGHNLGDAILKSTATSIQNSIRTGDHAFRFGGDEFLLILPCVNGGIANQICARIEASLREIHGYTFTLTMSMGCALRSGCTSTAEVLELADQRMYEFKRIKSNAEDSANGSPVK